MAITRAQQVRQMLEDGGMLVSPSKDGKRPGYRSAKAQEVQGRTKTSGFSAPSKPGQSPRGTTTSRDDDVAPGYNPKTGRFETKDEKGNVVPEKARTPEEVQASLDAAIQQGRFDKPSFLENFFGNYTKGTRKFLYDAIRNNPRSELAYLSKLTPSQAKGLPTARLRELYEIIQDTDFSGDLSFEDALGEDFEKLSFEDYDALTKFNDAFSAGFVVKGIAINFADFAKIEELGYRLATVGETGKKIDLPGIDNAGAALGSSM